MVRKEVIQSRFLAYLLSPLEQHKQGAKFLNAFLEQIGASKINDESQLAQVKVRPEGLAEELGRMDIVITAPSLLVVIENKIDAKEQCRQMARYQNGWKTETGTSRKAGVSHARWCENLNPITKNLLLFLIEYLMKI
ncbi:MAG: PD-(D/E)XK nuclease family protein [Bdellovibrionales bacterium]|nr:PD-(D/E)XK nuclease family protein [Bdellovibrionales bacterium]